MNHVNAVTFTILLVSANTIAMSVRERVREVGVLKTLGFTRGAILGIILGEAVAISLIGGVLGLAVVGRRVATVQREADRAEEGDAAEGEEHDRLTATASAGHPSDGSVPGHSITMVVVCVTVTVPMS